ncbi:glycosyltransferase family 69 protein [Sarocladium strictum]
MRPPSATRLYVRRFLRARTPKVLILLFIILNVLDVFRIHRDIAEGEKARYQLQPRPAQRLYIASMHFNNGKILRSHWIKELIRLTDTFGAQNMFVSVHESGSWDDSKSLLRGLDRELERRAVPRRIVISDVTHKDEMLNEKKGDGWIDTSRGQRELRRIPYLARLRNEVMQDLYDMHKKGIRFDKVIFLNDVVFKVEDVMLLMDTNGGKYAAACSLDFAKPPNYYDTFALRDSEGQAHAMQTWPYFKSFASRSALVHNHDAVPVKSCWNGIVVMPAAPFVDENTNLRFRGIDDSLAVSHLEGSECCLIHADNPLSKTMGVFINPRVRVAYNPTAWDDVHPRDHLWIETGDIFRGLWKNRLRRWLIWSFESWVVRGRVRAWEKAAPEGQTRKEEGEFCLINEMQVLAENGWKHV